MFPMLITHCELNIPCEQLGSLITPGLTAMLSNFHSFSLHFSFFFILTQDTVHLPVLDCTCVRSNLYFPLFEAQIGCAICDGGFLHLAQLSMAQVNWFRPCRRFLVCSFTIGKIVLGALDKLKIM
ncbi:hypothetical protein ASPBRDRAFT_291154 [Aspergillus brasiliensis CBS 101740]|uniref:Uncharacterized protein n=1 Tax=Aspergillus brasiliensis (strain CBS 101740 / IMI 381727 / IBT 21946) TaxID=767769 RepID=A0A1L9UBC2_ASPBC|nr:hypothetical protein ASPBRDRAFT_291154 [Aspergillus brasiliensis CBS 101740]